MDTEARRRESEEPERNRETCRGQEDRRNWETRRGTGGRWRSSRICQDREENQKRLCFKSKYLLLNNTFFNFFALLLPSSFFLQDSLLCLELLSCFASPPPCFSAQAGTRTAVFHTEGRDLTTEPLGLSH